MDTDAFQGKEEQTYNQSMYTKNSINKAITDKSKLADFLSAPERLVPPHMNPACHRMSMQVGDDKMKGPYQFCKRFKTHNPTIPTTCTTTSAGGHFRQRQVQQRLRRPGEQPEDLWHAQAEQQRHAWIVPPTGKHFN